MQENPSKISIIILNAFQMENLDECLRSIQTTNYPNFEIIVIDCLTDGIEEYLENNFPDVQLISLAEDVGPAAMHNIGLQNADLESKYIVFLDNDVIFEKNWLKELYFCINNNEQIGAVQSKIMLYDHPDLYNSKGNKANYLAVGWPDGYNTLDNGESKSREISFPSGACMIVRRDALEIAGGYDSDYFIYADDLDAGLRIMLAGYKILYCPTSTIYHKYKFLKKPRNFYFLNRNRISTYLKLYNSRTYVMLLPPFLFYEVSLFIYAIQNKCLPHLLRAYGDNLKNFSNIRQKRDKIKKIKTLSDRDIIIKLEGKIDFPEISNNFAVKYLLNPFLEKYRILMIGSDIQ